MKKLKSIFLFTLISSLMISMTGCLYTEIGDPGPQGPKGEQGPQGLPGPKGPKGVSKPADTVYYSEWDSYIGTQKGSRDYVATINVPQLTKGLLDSVMITVFYHNGTSGHSYIYKLPYTSATGGGQFMYFSVEPHKITLYATYNYFTSSRQFRYVIIPLNSDISIARKRASDGINDEDYQMFCNYYNIPK